jgi:hypothetical protein
MSLAHRRMTRSRSPQASKQRRFRLSSVRRMPGTYHIYRAPQTLRRCMRPRAQLPRAPQTRNIACPTDRPDMRLRNRTRQAQTHSRCRGSESRLSVAQARHEKIRMPTIVAPVLVADRSSSHLTEAKEEAFEVVLQPLHPSMASRVLRPCPIC